MQIYFYSGIMGNMLSNMVLPPDSISLGASTGIFGLIGCLGGFMILNWKAMQEQNLARSDMCFKISIIMAFLFLMSIAPGTDLFGHLGGLIGGILFGIILPVSAQKNPYERKCRIISIILTVIYVVCLFIFFYFFKCFEKECFEE